MRYSIIHHDVRNRFKLSLLEYCVIDSYFQLSHKKPTTASPEAIASFLGCSRDTVFSAKKKGIEMGLLVKLPDGITTSDEWDRNILFASGKSENPTKKSENPTNTQYIIKEDITSVATAPQSYEDYEDDLVSVDVDDNGDPIEPRKKKDTTYRRVFEAFGHNYPRSWDRNTTQIKAAKALLAERGEDQIRKALRFYLDNKQTPFIPVISTPYELDTKWEKLLQFKNK